MATQQMLGDKIAQTGAKPELKEPKKHRNFKKTFVRSFLTILILVILGGGYVGYKFITNEVKVFGWSGIWSLFFPGSLNSQYGRVNILLAGDSVGRTDNGAWTAAHRFHHDRQYRH